ATGNHEVGIDIADAGEGAGIGAVDFLVGHPLADSEVALAKPSVQDDRLAAALGDRPRGFGGAAQVARHQDVKTLGGQARGERARLREPLFGEVAVALPLDARLHVPLGLPMAHDDDAGHRLGFAPAQRSAASDFTSWSVTFTSRSSWASVSSGLAAFICLRMSITTSTAASISQ